MTKINDKLSLHLHKKATVIPTQLYYSGTERGREIEVSIIDNDDLTPLNLADKKVQFIEIKEDGKAIVDDGTQENGGKITVTDAENGKFTYSFPTESYQESGVAFFNIVTDEHHIDATEAFRINIACNIEKLSDGYISELVKIRD